MPYPGYSFHQPGRMEEHPPYVGPERAPSPRVHTFTGIKQGGGWEILDIREYADVIKGVSFQMMGLQPDGTMDVDTKPRAGFVVLGRPVPLSDAGEPIHWDFVRPVDCDPKAMDSARDAQHISLYCVDSYAYTVWISADTTGLPS